jgi:hypothetical protein
MKTLIYKRTHVGDPNEQGCFGIHRCMGKMRSWDFDVVIGVGGIGPWPRSLDIDRKINWVGIGPTRIGNAPDGWPKLAFDHFVLWDADGPLLKDISPALVMRIYGRRARFAFGSFNAAQEQGIEKILAMAKAAPPSKPACCSSSNKTKCCLPRSRHC